jgi:hypothetical protein
MINTELFMTKIEELQMNFNHTLPVKFLDFYFKKLNESMNDKTFTKAIDALISGEVKFYKSAVNPIPNVTEILSAGRSKINRAEYMESDEVKQLLRKRVLEFRGVFWNRRPIERKYNEETEKLNPIEREVLLKFYDKLSDDLKTWITQRIGKEAFFGLLESGDHYHRFSEQHTEDSYFAGVKNNLLKQFDEENGLSLDQGKDRNIGLDGMQGLLK